MLSIGSAGSILSAGSAGSILSIGSAGSILSIRSSGKILHIDDLSLAEWRRGRIAERNAPKLADTIEPSLSAG